MQIWDSVVECIAGAMAAAGDVEVLNAQLSIPRSHVWGHLTKRHRPPSALASAASA